LLQRRPLYGGSTSFDWLKMEPTAIQACLDWPFEGFWFDVQHNDVWWPEWGSEPTTSGGQHDRLRKVFAEAPRLIPLFGHRCLPEQPMEPGNPVLSVYRTDVICYGSDLHDLLERECDGWAARPWSPVKEIRFWSEALRKNNAEP
jgi:hypothetical protein